MMNNRIKQLIYSLNSRKTFDQLVDIRNELLDRYIRVVKHIYRNDDEIDYKISDLDLIHNAIHLCTEKIGNMGGQKIMQTNSEKITNFSHDVPSNVGVFYRNRLTKSFKDSLSKLVYYISNKTLKIITVDYLEDIANFLTENYEKVTPFIPEGDRWIEKTYNDDLFFVNNLIDYLNTKLWGFYGI